MKLAMATLMANVLLSQLPQLSTLSSTPLQPQLHQLHHQTLPQPPIPHLQLLLQPPWLFRFNPNLQPPVQSAAPPIPTIMVSEPVSAILAFISQPKAAFKVLLALPTAPAKPTVHANVMMDSPTTMVSALNALLVLFGAHKPTPASLSVVKTLFTALQLTHVFATPATVS